jgi:hypothetical protein
MRTLSRPELQHPSGDLMPKRGRASNKNRRRQSRGAKREKAGHVYDTYIPKDKRLELEKSLPRPSLTVAWTEENVPELVALQLRAIHKYDIRPKEQKYPLKKVLVEHFEGLRLSTGELISRNFAEFLASACRPVEGRKGGNKKKG